MAKFFISYARIDITVVEEIIDTLRHRYSHANVWYDQELHNRGGEDWWEEILNAVGSADIFIYLLSKESVESPYCQAELEEALRLQKRLIFIQIRDRTPLPPIIASRQYADMSKGINDLKIWTALYNSIDYQISQIQARRPRPLNTVRTPRPEHAESAQVRSADVSVTTPALKIPQPAQLPSKTKRWWEDPRFLIGVVLIPLVVAVITVLPSIIDANNKTPLASPTTAVASNTTEHPTAQSTDEPALTITHQPTETELSIAQIVGTLDAQATVDQATANAEAAIAKRATDYAQMTQDSLNQTATATLWTQTPTPNMTASIEAYRTEQAATTTQIWIASWTATPTPTFTPTNTPTATFTSTPNATTTLVAFRPMSNSDWKPIERDFDGVTMMLVPVGCFMMGSTRSYDEQPVHEQCFDAPFWIDKTEVTQSQFQRLGGVNASDNGFTGNERPVERITWFEARDFCALRDAQLPTEAEWEYAARGPDNLLYPWGNEFIADNVVYGGNSNSQTAVVGSRPAGTSWWGHWI